VLTSDPGRRPLVSVVVATNRGGAYLREAIESVAAQSWPHVELFVVSDGAPDVADIEAAMTAMPTATLMRQAAAGVGVARNRAVARAHGEFVVFLDDDDRWHTRRLEAAVAALVAQPEAPLAYCRFQTIDAAGAAVLAPADQTAIGSRLDVARGSTGIIAPNIMVRRAAFQSAGGFHSRIRLAEDLDLVLRLAELGPFAFVAETLVDYRLTGANATAKHRALASGVAAVLRLHRSAAEDRGDAELVAALRTGLRSNSRYAWWASLRAARSQLSHRRVGAAAGEVLWALRVAPAGLALGAMNRLRRPH